MKLILEDKGGMKDLEESIDIPKDVDDAGIIKASIALLRRIRR